jgi:hypothetical protein
MRETLNSTARRLLVLAVAPVLIAVSVLTALPARALDATICDGPDRFVLLTDPTGVANDALCREQERVLKELSEGQWGQEYTAQQRLRILNWAQDQALGALYVDLLRIAELPATSRTADEATVYTWFQQTIAGLRTRLANAAYAEQIEYANNPCGYTPPGPDATLWAACDTSSAVLLFGGPPGPTYEDFVNFGAERLLGEELPGIQSMRAAAADRAARAQALATIAGVGGGAALSGGLLALLAAGATSSAATVALTGVGSSATLAAAGAGAVSTFVAASAIAVTAVVICIVIAVVRGVQVFTEAEIPGKLRDDITNAGTLVDVVTWLKASDGNNFIALTALAGRVNQTPPPSAPVPTTPSGTSPNFLVTGGTGTQFTKSLQYQSPLVDGQFLTTWLDEGWWVIKDADGGLAMTHTLQFTDHDGSNRTAVATDDGFLLYRSDAVSPQQCDASAKCETTTSLPLMAPGEGGITAVQRTATLADAAIDFTLLPTVASTYELGDTLDVQATAHASYITTMSYQWKLVRHASGADITDSEDGSRMYRQLQMPGDYTLSVTATASSGESGTHAWDFTVTGTADGQLSGNILVTQYPDDSTDGTPPLFPGPWLEGDSHGTLCVSTGSTDPTDYQVEFVGGPTLTREAVTDGYACFQRPAGTEAAGVHPLQVVGACPTGQLCFPPIVVDPVKGVTTSVFSYEVTNLPGTISNPVVGLEGDAGVATGPSGPLYFAAGDTVELHADVTDPGGTPQTVTVTWSDGWVQTFPAVASGGHIVAKHTFTHSSLGPVGAHVVGVDSVGETANIAAAWFVVRPVPLQVDVTAQADAAGRVALAGGLTDAEGGATYVIIEWGDGTHDTLQAPFASLAGAAAFPDADSSFDASHIYAGGAPHTVTVTAYNGAATNAIATAVVTIPASAPALASDGPITIGDDGTASFDATLADLTPGDTLGLYADFGDGAVGESLGHASGDTVTWSHQYAPGRYYVTLVAADAGGLNSPVVTRCLVVGATLDSEPCPDAVPATDVDLAAHPAGPVSGPSQAHPGDTITMTAGSVNGGDGVFGFIYSTPTPLGSYLADASGTGTLTVPANMPLGSHLIALFVGGQLVGYAPIEIVAADGGNQGGGDQDGGNQGGGDQSGSDQSGSDQSGGDQSGGDQSGSDQSSGDPSGADQSDSGALSGTGADVGGALALAALLLTLGGALAVGGRPRALPSRRRG